MDEKAMTLRLPQPVADEVATIAAVAGISQADFIREAITAHIEARRADPAFRASAARFTSRLSRLAAS